MTETRQPWMVNDTEAVELYRDILTTALATLDREPEPHEVRDAMRDAFGALREYAAHAQKLGMPVGPEWHHAFESAMFHFIDGRLPSAEENLRDLGKRMLATP